MSGSITPINNGGSVNNNTTIGGGLIKSFSNLVSSNTFQKQQQQQPEYNIINITENHESIIHLHLNDIDHSDENQQFTALIKNNTRKFYFKGIINSIGKVPTTCEDSHFLSQDFTAVGVADGVGSWRSVGVDPGEYSRSLMKHANNLSNSINYLKPFDLIEQAYNQTQNIQGSSTVCILKLIGTRMYHGLVGDSSFLIIRKDQILYRSKEQTHKPNHPFQLGQGSTDRPTSGDYNEHNVQENDIVVIGTDGFFDNVFDEEVLEAIRKVESVETFFKLLMDIARSKSVDPNSNTPHGVRNQHRGGKQDDITVGCFVISYNQKE
ncbi:protein phosphatase 2C-related protein [Heterostelium album PN500]|uniref:Protein phosphatase 2C-related protein n=1 Tax=Heterostelium pallidum (strain ATCC 26659 / Pp 5 / PN500) TaxID=670386 RepID=D3B194_HETP5|nr:protein phosphatase 2C-related protein [Heterostelium album PN500]EFA85068.1 protein phosphatase 2C-related protein [Heterostelium album PN500]|eukprot:XP_020437178.1 protein phosphatase 2C-related protein [Heterostelium album PN500]